MAKVRLKTSKKKEEKTTIGLRVSKKEKNKIKQKANLYTGGNISEWILYCAVNYVPDKEELE